MNIKEFLDFVDFLKNVDKYEQRAKLLQDENDRLETNIKLTSEIADIPKTKQLTASLLSEAKETLETAKKEANDLKDKARTSYDKRLADLVVREEAATKAAQEAKAVAGANAVTEATTLADLKRQLVAVETERQKLSTSQAEVDDRLAKLKSVMG